MTVNAISKHAESRCQQRGIHLGLLHLILSEADMMTHVGGGVRALQISRRRIGVLRGKGGPSHALDRLNGVTVLVAGYEVVTAFHAQRRAGRPYRRQYKNGHRRRRDVH